MSTSNISKSHLRPDPPAAHQRRFSADSIIRPKNLDRGCISTLGQLHIIRERDIVRSVVVAWQVIGTGRIVMAVKDTVAMGHATALNRAEGNRTETSSLPKPEQGLRLIHAFVSIREDAVREAIVRFVEELSTAKKDG